MFWLNTATTRKQRNASGAIGQTFTPLSWRTVGDGADCRAARNSSPAITERGRDQVENKPGEQLGLPKSNSSGNQLKAFQAAVRFP